jgi:hypothetical protein
MYIDGSTANVGIGVTSPASKLDVTGTDNGDTVRVANTGTYGGTISFNQGSGNTNIGYVGSIRAFEGNGSGDNGIGLFSRNRISFYLNSASPSVTIATSGTLTVSGDVVAYGNPSDKRLKENIKPIESALDKAMKLQGVTFDWKKSDSILKIKEDIGFIAQDVQKVVPELVRENEDGMLSMRHQGIAPILIEAIKELKAEIDLLKSKPCTCNKCNCKE